MIYVYINYPNSGFTIHRSASCPQIRVSRKEGQRIIRINVPDQNEIQATFTKKTLKFASTKELNDLWLEISVELPELEDGILSFIRELLGTRYKRLINAPVRRHC